METILATKLHMPISRADLVSRSALVERLNCGLKAGSRLTLISASAGYGKTTLVYEWLTSSRCPAAWLSLDAEDNEPARFFRYLLAAVQSVAACVSEQTIDAIKEQQLSPAEVVASLVNDLTHIKDRLFIVLDDYHLIESGPIHQAVQMLIEYLPTAVHMVLITRTDPPISIPRFRARGQLTEIRIDDLRFSTGETESFFSQTMHLEIAPDQVDTLERRTEGWITGLQLAALAIQHTPRGSMNSFVQEFGGNHKYIIDYLVEEVLNHLPPETCNFLTTTSLLDRFCAPLADAVLNIQTGGAQISELEKSNLFIVSLDDERMWFRYHHLFADSLASRLSVSQKSVIYLKASEWFDHNAYPRDAVEYAFRSGNQDQAFRMVEKSKTHMFETGPLTLLVKWLERLPDERILESETLCVNKAVAYLLTGDQKFGGYMKKLDDTFFKSASDDNKARILYLRAQMAESSDPPAALRMVQQGLSIMSEEDVILKAATMNIAASILLNEGTAAEAIQAAREAYKYGLAYDNSFNTIASLAHYANSLDVVLRRRDAMSALQEYLDRGIHKSIAPPSSTGILYVTLGSLLYEANELDAADENCERGVELYKKMGPFWLDKLGPVRFYAKFALGQTEAALQVLQEYSTPQYLAGTSFDFKISALRAEVQLKLGNLDGAQKWTADWALSPTYAITASREMSALTYARLLMLQGQTDQAQLVLSRIEDSASGGGRTKHLLKALLLRTVLLQKCGREEDALVSLNPAIELAAPDGYCRAFLDEPELSALLLKSKYASTPFVLKTLGFCNTDAAAKTVQPALHDPDALSGRELELLAQMAMGLSNQEIADKLFISLNTVQWHITHIYEKLCVKNRIGAVKKAQDEHLI